MRLKFRERTFYGYGEGGEEERFSPVEKCSALVQLGSFFPLYLQRHTHRETHARQAVHSSQLQEFPIENLSPSFPPLLKVQLTFGTRKKVREIHPFTLQSLSFSLLHAEFLSENYETFLSSTLASR